MSNQPSQQPPSNHLEIIVLAAGQGTRMNSRLPKVLHTLAGRPLLAHVLDRVSQLNPQRIHVVVGHMGEAVRDAVQTTNPGLEVNWVEQAEQLGTGHAVQQVLPSVAEHAALLVVLGDVPLITTQTLQDCVAKALAGGVVLVTADFADPAELGRIMRDGSGAIQSIVEFKDADPAQRAVCEINSGIMAAAPDVLQGLLSQVRPRNAQDEYYLTDVVALAVTNNVPVEGLKAECSEEVTGINDRIQLAELERHYQRCRARALMRDGTTIADPARLDIRGEVSAGIDCFIDVNVVLEGRVVLGRGVVIGPGAVIRDSELGDGVWVQAHTVIEGAQVAADCILGPFARIRPGTELGAGVKIGNFVETKNSVFGAGTKASHLAYLGDATLGEGCNVGAGTVTCNYDGVDKHPTTIGDGVFVGTNVTLVAPLVIEDGAYVGAGSTITTKVGKDELAVGRSRQRNLQGWVRPDKRAARNDQESKAKK
ncbi:MAG: bifunctional UDP-N-acetylglucosamine diphosphorylase/glucosamine-1-phosphate N-acetyltransferase GlmU [Gammaproteobacteria bacterium]|nr:bifunctional UDP-N-acetylglucosamine diphosphorylase/glucosamine-1-phosphate N-acetyltransferase GlmU [Gammaproteobacteria bacterium]